MKFIPLLLLLFVSALLPAQDKQDARPLENNLVPWIIIENEPPVRWTIDERLKFLRIPSVSIAIIRDYKVVYAKAFGQADKEAGKPATTATLYQAASISKSLNAVGLLKLVQQGKIDLNADINKYLTTWHPSADSGTITLRNLLSHTAGLSVHGFPGYDVKDSIPSVEQVLQGIRPANTKTVKPLFAPNVKVQYSGGGTTVSQLIAMTVTGMPYDRYMQQAVLNPMGMTQSFYTQPAPDSKKEVLSAAYYESGKPVNGKYHIYPEQGAAGLWTNPTDLAAYIIESQLALEGKSAKVLDQATTKTRLTPVMASAALGVFLTDDKKYFAHGGANEGYRCSYYGSLTGGNGWVAMTNSDNNGIIDEVQRAVAITYGWNDFYKPEKAKSAPLPADSAKAWAGGYKSDFLTLLVKESGGKLTVYHDENPPLELICLEDKSMVSLSMPAYFRFQNGELVIKQFGRTYRLKKQP